MWPRHTGDFTVFRIYADSANNPAKYSTKNIPLKPAYHLPISLKGIKKNDFAMVWGYPGNTSRYLTSYGIEFNLAVLYPTITAIFGKELDVMKERMDADKAVKIAYAGNYAQIANTWKNFIGQSKMLKRNKVEDKKKEIEKAFVNWYSKDPALQKKVWECSRKSETGLCRTGQGLRPHVLFFLGGSSLGIVQVANRSSAISEAYEKKDKDALAKAIEAYRSTIPEMFKDKDQAIEKKQFAEILNLYVKNVAPEDQPGSSRKSGKSSETI